MVKEYKGIGSIENLRAIIQMYQPSSILLVTGNKSYAQCGAEAVLEKLLASWHTSRFFTLETNPKAEDVERGVVYSRKIAHELVIAIGGGSVIDMAKMINCFSAQEGPATQYILKGKSIEHPAKPLVAIPTTAGSGSEATRFAVVYIDKKKHSVSHDLILPSYVILDSQFTKNLPRQITASTGLDALSQAVESYWCVNSTYESKEYSKKAIGLILENLKQAVNNPSIESREAMLIAANLAGKSINITKTTAPHAISYVFSSHFAVPHGHAVALTLGELFVHNSFVTENDLVDSRGVEYVRKTMTELSRMMGCNDALEAREYIKKLMKIVGIQTRLSELGITKEDFKTIAKNVNQERLNNNPRVFSQDDLVALLHRIT